MRYFIILSIAIHISLFSVWYVSKPDTYQTASAIQLSLLTIPDLSTKPPAPIRDKQKLNEALTKPNYTATENNGATAICANNHCATVPQEQFATQDTSAQDDSKTSTAPVIAAPQNGRIQQQLEQALTVHFNYPRIARKKGWQGTVELGLHVNENGALSQIHIINSSGYGILDHAAMNSLRQISSIPEVVSWLGGQGFDIIFPVKYRLLDT